MSTFLSDFIEQLDEKWKEIDILLTEAEKHEESNSDLYNALCRSITVLIVAHLEGFTKDLVKAVVRDLNQFHSFDMLPIAMQRTYCTKYLGHPPEKKSDYDNKIKLLSKKFCETKIKISYEPFLTTSNKNPKPETLKSIFKNFGITGVFLNLKESSLDNIFSETNNEMKDKISDFRGHLKKEIITFPYQCTKERLLLNKSTKLKKNKRTLWQEFLDEINRKRHAVAHGNDFDNSECVKALHARKNRVIYLQLGLVEFLASITRNDNTAST